MGSQCDGAMRWVCVVNYQTMSRKYLGHCALKAAEHLVPGTSFGWGDCKTAAENAAFRNAARQSSEIRRKRKVG